MFILCPFVIIVLTRNSWKGLVLRLSVVTLFLILAALGAFVIPVLTGTEVMAANRFIFLVCATVFTISSMQLLVAGSNAHATVDAIRRLGIPYDIVWMIVLAIRYLPIIKEEGIRIHQAARSRLWSPGKRTIRVLGWMSGSLFIRSFEKALRTAQAMEARGYGKMKQSPASPSLSLLDIAFLLLYPGLILAIRFVDL